MDKQVSWVLDVNVKAGQVDAFRDLMNEMVAATEQEPGALSYEWFLSEDESRVHMYERYADSDATMAHLANFGENFADRFLSLVEPKSFSVYGEANDQVREALVPFGAEHLTTFGGFVR